MHIVFYPDPVLQQRAQEVDPAREGLRDLAEAMIEVMGEAPGVGLAAPQVGESLRLFVATPTGEVEDAQVFINPRIEPHGALVPMEEGCLSVPGVSAQISRPGECRITYTDLDGHEQTEDHSELMARILQHEFDHIEGVLFTERMTPTDRLRVQPDLRTFEEQYRPKR